MLKKLKKRLRASLLPLRGNEGFSLPELVIAIVILAISAGIILHAFLTSVNLTKKAVKLNEASDAAQNIQETIEAFSYNTFMSGTEDIIRYLGIAEDDFSSDSDEKQVTLKNLTSGNSIFDAVVKFNTGSANFVNNEIDFDSTDGFYLINNKEISSYSAQKAAFQQSTTANPDTAADANFKQFVYNCHELTGKSRSINLNIVPVSDEEGNVSAFRVDGSFDYTFNYTVNVDKTGGTIIQPATPYTTSIPIHAQTSSGSNTIPFSTDEAYTTVFVGFWPVYADSTIKNYNEEINIYNREDLPVRIILVKQKPQVLVAEGKYEPMKETDLLTNENQYIVHIYEYHSLDFVQQYLDDPESDLVKTMLTNAGLNLALDGGKIGSINYKIRGDSNGHTGKELNREKIIKAGKLVNSEKIDRLFDVTIEIYDPGELDKAAEDEEKAAVPFASFNGNKLS